MKMEDVLHGRSVIVTGASGGIGTALCRKLAGYGMRLTLVGRNAGILETVAQTVRGLGGEALVCPGDLKSDAFLSEIPQKAVEAFGQLDVLINNAGLAQNDAFEQVTPELFDTIMATNVRAPYFLCQKALPYLRKSDMATIINICSVVGHKGYPMQSLYAASKHALLGMSKSLANEVYEENIRVHVISPGAVYTDMVALTRPDLSPEGMILAEDIADAAGYFLEHRSSNAVIDELEIHRRTKAPFA